MLFGHDIKSASFTGPAPQHDAEIRCCHTFHITFDQKSRKPFNDKVKGKTLVSNAWPSSILLRNAGSLSRTAVILYCSSETSLCVSKIGLRSTAYRTRIVGWPVTDLVDFAWRRGGCKRSAEGRGVLCIETPAIEFISAS